MITIPFTTKDMVTLLIARQLLVGGDFSMSVAVALAAVNYENFFFRDGKLCVRVAQQSKIMNAVYAGCGICPSLPTSPSGD